MQLPELNPFQCGRPIVDPVGFFGREKELRQLSGLLSQLNWVSIVGPRRIGKTSLLRQLCHSQVADMLGLASPEYAIVFMDPQGLQQLDAAGWRSLLVGRAAEALGLAPPGDVRNGFQFQEAFRRILAGGRKLILLLDEFEILAGNSHLDADFYGGLRALTGYAVSIVTASCSPLKDLTYQDRNIPYSPFFNVFFLLPLGLLEEAAGRALLARPEAGLPPEMMMWLMAQVGSHPFFLQIAGYYAFERLHRRPWNQVAAQEVCREIGEAINPHLQYAWAHLSPPARYALATLPLVRAGDPALAELRAACLVRHDAYLSPLVEAFVRRQALPEVLHAGELWVDLRRSQAVFCAQPLALPDLSYRLLRYFLEHDGRPIPWLQLERDVWGQFESLLPDYDGNPERVDVAVDRLRKVLRGCGASDPIRVQRGVYTFDPDLVGVTSSG